MKLLALGSVVILPKRVDVLIVADSASGGVRRSLEPEQGKREERKKESDGAEGELNKRKRVQKTKQTKQNRASGKTRYEARGVGLIFFLPLWNVKVTLIDAA